MAIPRDIPCESIMESLADGVFTVDLDWNITFFNRAAAQVTGVPQAEAVGRKCWEVLRSSVCDGSCVLKSCLEAGEARTNRSLYFVRADGVRVPVSISAAPLKDRRGRVIGGVETFRDLSAVQLLQKKLDGRYSLEDIHGRSPALARILEILPQIAASPASALLLGESGTGKELFARALHSLSPRSKGPFVAVNCGALPENLLESELFGYKAGAFTDARKDKPGLFELAEGGSIFLDEIGDLPPDLQAKLLQVLEDRSFYPLGATTPTAVNVRVLSATNHDLAAMAQAGRFRSDLYYRLRVVELRIPPLRERPGDIPLLLDHFLAAAAGRYRRTVRAFSPEARRLLAAHPFPGNVRELKHVVEQAVLLCSGDTVEPSHLPQYLAEAPRNPGPEDAAGGSLADRERRLLLEALAENDWSVGSTAQSLGINRSTLWRRMRKYGI